MAGYQKS